MANLPETAQWEAGVYQLETTDPVEGGPDGIDNQQAKQLANRTAYLKQLIEGLDAGTYSIAEVDAAIVALQAVDADLQDQINTKTTQATETAKGTAELATTSEAQAGTDDLRIMTPKNVHEAFSQFGLGIDGAILSNEDLDSYTATGFYRIGTSAPNSPTGAASWLIHQSYGTDRESQFVISSQNELYCRSNISGWSDWVQLATTNNALAFNQAWQDVAASRSVGVTYTNSTGKPIMVAVSVFLSVSIMFLVVDGLSVAQGKENDTSYGSNSILTAIVPPGSTYKVTGGSLQQWTELR